MAGGEAGSGDEVLAALVISLRSELAESQAVHGRHLGAHRPGLVRYSAEDVEDQGVNVIGTDHAPIVPLALPQSTSNWSWRNEHVSMRAFIRRHARSFVIQLERLGSSGNCNPFHVMNRVTSSCKLR